MCFILVVSQCGTLKYIICCPSTVMLAFYIPSLAYAYASALLAFQCKDVSMSESHALFRHERCSDDSKLLWCRMRYLMPVMCIRGFSQNACA